MELFDAAFSHFVRKGNFMRMEDSPTIKSGYVQR